MVRLELGELPLEKRARLIAAGLPALGDEEDLVAPPREHATQRPLRVAVAREVRRRVHEVDAEVDRLVEERRRLIEGARGAGGRRPHAEDRHAHAGAPKEPSGE